MYTKYQFESEPEIVMKTGQALPEDITPSKMTRRTFVNALMDELFVAVNPVDYHVCNNLCRTNAQVVLFKHGHLAIDLVPR